jgi:hypothetical protein
MKKHFSTIIILSILFVTSARPQFNFYAYYQGIYDDNIFNTSEKVLDFINAISFGTAYNFESEFNNVQLYYEGNLNYFKTTTSKSFDAHRIGLVETHLFSIDDNPFNAGVNYSFRNNKDEYEVYDFQQISAYINYRHSISDGNFILPGYIFNNNIYKNFTLYSNYEHRLFVSWISNFETQTSLSINCEYLFKDYVEKYDYEDYLNEASLLKLRVNVGQSLGDLTGLNAYLIYQKDLSEGSRYIISDSLIYYEEEIFNDIYSYDGIETGLGFKHYFNENIEMNLETKYLIRNYSSLPAADRNGLELDYLREDNQFGFGAGILFDLGGVINGLSFSAAWNYINNNSNDYYYKYSNQMISFSVGYDL